MGHSPYRSAIRQFSFKIFESYTVDAVVQPSLR
jgi:hypothetical protein